MKNIEQYLQSLADSGNLRSIPQGGEAMCADVLDLTSNDYLGIAEDAELRCRFFETLAPEDMLLTSSASRLLATRQRQFAEFETILEELYGKPALTFDSGYHANTGMIAALGDKHTLILADRLVHASIIDGMRLSGARFMRYAHNDYAHLEALMHKFAPEYSRVLIVSESVFSMDGDRADVEALIHAKRLHPNALLYIDEAHAVGVCGPQGLGLARPFISEVDILVGTLGKALAAQGAYAIMSSVLRDYMINSARSLIFSTALPPISLKWSTYIMRRVIGMDRQRQRLSDLGKSVADVINASGISNTPVTPSHIIPVIVGDAVRAVQMSQALKQRGVLCLPIRTPTVPAGTERLRLSLNASLTDEDVRHIADAFRSVACQFGAEKV